MELLHEQLQCADIRYQHGTADEHEAGNAELTSSVAGKRITPVKEISGEIRDHEGNREGCQVVDSTKLVQGDENHEPEGRVCQTDDSESCERDQMVGHFGGEVAPLRLLRVSAATASE
jgi:hypothetical protein